MSQFKPGKPYITRWLRFPTEGRYAQLHYRLKVYAYQESIKRNIAFSMQDAMLELMDEMLKEKGYPDERTQ
jgi:hypothetical protein